MSTWRIACPHCGKKSTVRTSKVLCETVREATITCNNPLCMHSWVAQLAAVRTLAPSINPNPRVFIPISPHTQAAKAAADASQLELVMDHPPPRMASG